MMLPIGFWHVSRSIGTGLVQSLAEILGGDYAAEDLAAGSDHERRTGDAHLLAEFIVAFDWRVAILPRETLTKLGLVHRMIGIIRAPDGNQVVIG